jgi:hypothetical protein
LKSGRIWGGAVLFSFKPPRPNFQKKNQNLGFFLEKKSVEKLNSKKKIRPEIRPDCI